MDIDYPTHLHDLHVEFPLAPEHYDDRLCTTLFNKKHYLVHSQILQYYVRNGLQISKVHSVWVFNQNTVFKSYVNRNIDMRRKNKNNKALSDMYKLLNNSLYGKTLENAFKYRRFSVKKAKTEGPYGRVNSFLSYVKNFLEIDEYFLCELENNLVRLDKPVQLGFAILELAKLEVYKFYYNLKWKFSDRLQLLYHDTDSLILYFQNCHQHPLLTMIQDVQIGPCLDYENAPDNYVIRTYGTEKVPGLWSDQVDCKTITEYVGLRAKTYCVKFLDGECILKNKGVKSSATIANTNAKINFDDYKKCLFNNEHIFVDQYLIRSQSHTLYSTRQKNWH